MDTEVLDRPTVPVTTRPKTTADILEAAALVIEEFGWIQGKLGSVGEGFCVSGAIGYADGWNGREDGLDDACHGLWGTVLRELCVTTGTSGPSFNDAPDRHAWEVTAALREAAKRARAVTTRSAQDGS